LLGAAAVGLFATGLASAQGPKPAGAIGLECVIEEGGVNTSDNFVVLNLATAVPGTSLSSVLNISLDTDVDGDNLVDVLKVNGAENGTSWQVQSAPEMTVAFDPQGGFLIFVPTRVENLGNVSAVSYLDFRAAVPPAFTPTVGAVLLAGSYTDIPYQMLSDGLGRVYVAESQVGSPLVVNQIDFGGGAVPSINFAAQVNGQDTEFQDRMALGIGANTISVPHSGGIDILSIPGLSLLGQVTMGLNTLGNPYQPMTNILAGLPGPFDMLAFLGDPVSGGHSFATWSSTTGLSGPTGGVDPAGFIYRPAAGFHEPAFSPLTPTTGTVTGLFDQNPLGTGSGMALQISYTLAGPGTVTITGIAAPFGDPEPARNNTGDPVAFQCRVAPVDNLCAITAGAAGPVGLTNQVPLFGTINPADSPRPLAMSLAIVQASDFALTTAGSSSQIEVYNVAPNLTFGLPPVIAAGSILPVAGGPTSLGRVYSQEALGGPLPLHFQQCTGSGDGVRMSLGNPFFAVPFTLLALDSQGIPAMGAGGLIAVPTAQSSIAKVAASRTSLNYQVPGSAASAFTLHPSPALGVSSANFATVALGTAYGLTAAWYKGNAFVTEFLSL
jgi:hypothetical protein